MEYSKQGDFDRAMAEFWKLLAAHPDYTAGYFMAAQTWAGRRGPKTRKNAAWMASPRRGEPVTSMRSRRWKPCWESWGKEVSGGGESYFAGFAILAIAHSTNPGKS